MTVLQARVTCPCCKHEFTIRARTASDVNKENPGKPADPIKDRLGAMFDELFGSGSFDRARK